MKKSDNRKQNRLRPSKQTYAVMRPMFETMGRVLDISSDGLSIEYIATNGVDDQFTEIDLMLMDEGLLLQKLPCRIVYDNEMEETCSRVGLTVRRLRYTAWLIERKPAGNAQDVSGGAP